MFYIHIDASVKLFPAQNKINENFISELKKKIAFILRLQFINLQICTFAYDHNVRLSF